MSKEMIVSCSSHETKIAILEDDQVTELYFERGKEYTLAGSICKGRVTRVLPGMQSAFVDIALERDAFLYVSDFLEDLEEYDRIASTVEDKVTRMDETARAEAAALAAPPPAIAETEASEPAESSTAPAPSDNTAVENAPTQGFGEQEAVRPPQNQQRPAGPPEAGSQGRPEREGRYSRRGRRRRPHHKGFPDSKYAKRPAGPTPGPAPSAPSPTEAPIILPGESLAKYKDWSQSEQSQSGDAQSVPDSYTPDDSASFHAPSVAEAPFEQHEHGTEAQSQPPAEALDVSSLNIPGVEVPSLEDVEDVRVIEEQADAPPEAPEAVSSAPSSSEESSPQPSVSEQPAPEQWQAEAEEPVLPPDVSSEESFLSTAADTAEPATEAGSESAERQSEIPQEPVQERANQPGAPQKATVRERYRNPRYMRRGRWMARKEGGRPEPAQAHRGNRPKERVTAQPLIADLLKEGQEILVQIAKEPLGKKGARITSHIALPGRYLVYMPTVNHIGVSRKIASDEERQRLKRIILQNSQDIPGGFIVRTAGEGHSEEDFRQDILYLSRLWAETRAQAEKVSAPALLHHDLNLVLRTLRDQLSEEFSAVWVDNEQEYENILSMVSKFQPTLVNRVKLYTKDVPLFDELGINEEINKALKPKVWLKSGGYIVINQTEALVAIDVNTGKFVGKSNRLEDTIVKTNVDAIKEIVRQIRLRDLGGIIVVDFIDMDERKNRQKVMAAMEEALKSDRSPSKILSFNEFGLVAITRKRVRQSLERTLCQPCAYCGGSGLVKSVTTVCNEILAEAKKIASELERRQITLRVNPEIGKTLKARETGYLQEIEEVTGKTVIIRNDPSLHMENFDFN